MMYDTTFSWKNYNKEEERNYNRNRLLIKRGKIFIFPHEPDPPSPTSN